MALNKLGHTLLNIQNYWGRNTPYSTPLIVGALTSIFSVWMMFSYPWPDRNVKREDFILQDEERRLAPYKEKEKNLYQKVNGPL